MYADMFNWGWMFLAFGLFLGVGEMLAYEYEKDCMFGKIYSFTCNTLIFIGVMCIIFGYVIQT